MDFAEKLRNARHAAGISQAQLARDAGITARSIQYYESGVRQPQSATVVVALANALGIPAESLMDLPNVARLQEQTMHESRKAEAVSLRHQLNDALSQSATLLFREEISEQDRLAFMRAINDIFFDSERNRGTSHKAYRLEDYLE